MKILIFSHEFPPVLGGAGMVAYDYARALSAEGHDVTVLTASVKGRSVARDVFRIVEITFIRKLWFLSYRKAVNFDEYDKIILNDPGAIYTAGLFFNANILAKSICFLHGSEPELIFDNISLSKRFVFFRYFYIKSLQKSEKIIAVSHYLKSKFIERNKLVRFSNKIEVIHNRIDKQLFHPVLNKNFRYQHGLNNDSVILLSVSRLVEMKGYRNKLQIFKQLLQLAPERDWKWLIIGDGEFHSEFSHLVKANGIEHSVILLGSKLRSDLRHYYSNADVFWLLSNFDEAFGMVYLEAQACGCPTIGRNRAGTVEAIVDGVTGYLVDNDEQCKNLLLSSLRSLESMKYLFNEKNKIDLIDKHEKSISQLLIG